MEYGVPVIKLSDYSLEDIFDNKMYFLIPFYFFNLEKRFTAYNKNEEDLREFTEIFCDIIERLKNTKESDLSDRSKRVIIFQMVHVVKKLAKNRKNVREKVGEIMGGTPMKMKWLEEYDAAIDNAVREERKKNEEELRKNEEELKKNKEEIKKKDEIIKALEEELKKAKVAML